MHSRFIIAAFIISFFTSVTSHAQIEKTHFSVKRNYGIPVGKSKESNWGKPKTGYGAGVNLNFFVRKNLAFGFDASFLEFGSKSEKEKFEVSKELFNYVGTFNYYFSGTWLKPHLTGGFGMSHEKFLYKLINEKILFDEVDKINVPTIHFGFGLNLKFTERTFIYFENKWVTIFSNNQNIRIKNKTEKIRFNTSYISLFAGLNYEIKY